VKRTDKLKRPQCGRRINGEYASAWTLLAIAVRLGQALGLGSEENIGYTPFEVQERRRTWYCIGILDNKVSLDRGTEHMISFAQLGEPPLDIDDSDMDPSSSVILPRDDFTTSTVNTLQIKAVRTHKRMCEATTWAEKVKLVDDFVASTGGKYGASFHPKSQHEEMAKFVVSGTRLAFQLLLRRPPYKVKGAVPPTDEFDVLEGATDTIEDYLNVQSTPDINWARKEWMYVLKSFFFSQAHLQAY
jgi:hypothetical protein